MSAAILYDWDFWTSSESRNDIHGLHPPYESGLAFSMRIDLVTGIKVPSTSMKLDDEATPDGPIPECGPPPTSLNRSVPNVLLIGDSISMGTGGDKYADGTWIPLGYGWDVQLSLEPVGLAQVQHNGGWLLEGQAGASKHGAACVDHWLGSGPWDVVHINFGL